MQHQSIERGYAKVIILINTFDEKEGYSIDDPENLENGVRFDDISYSAARIWNEFKKEYGYSVLKAKKIFIKEYFYKNFKRAVNFITKVGMKDDDMLFVNFIDRDHQGFSSELVIAIKEEVLRKIISYGIKKIPEKVFFKYYDTQEKKHITGHTPNSYLGNELNKEALKGFLEEDELSSLNDSELFELSIMFGILIEDVEDEFNYLGCDDDAYECVKKACSDSKALRKFHNFLKALRYSASSVIGENYQNNFLSFLGDEFKNWAGSKASWQIPRVIAFEIEDIPVPEKLGIDHKERIYAPINRIEKYEDVKVKTLIGFVVVEHDVLTPGSILELTFDNKPKIFKDENEEILDLDYLHILDIQSYSDIEVLFQKDYPLWQGGFNFCAFPGIWSN